MSHTCFPCHAWLQTVQLAPVHCSGSPGRLIGEVAHQCAAKIREITADTQHSARARWYPRGTCHTWSITDRDDLQASRVHGTAIRTNINCACEAQGLGRRHALSARHCCSGVQRSVKRAAGRVPIPVSQQEQDHSVDEPSLSGNLVCASNVPARKNRSAGSIPCEKT